MIKYFMSGTKYEPFEGMMMSPGRCSGKPAMRKRPQDYDRNAREKKNISRLP